MPNYSYSCNDCSFNFELFFYIRDYQSSPLCPNCNSPDTYRLYAMDVSTQSCSVKKSDSELKTLGDLANRNRDKLSDDQKIDLHNKHNSYKHDAPTTTLPKGMSRMNKPIKKNKWT